MLMGLSEPTSGNETWLSMLLVEALFAREEERQAITTVLREDVGQSLAALALYLRVLESNCKTQECAMKIQEARNLLSDILKSVEQLTRRLTPLALENQGLGPALEVYAQDFAQIAGSQVELDLEVLSTRAVPEVELALFRIAQEALESVNNASVVRIALRRVKDQLCLAIEDNGTGYSPEMLLSWRVLWMTQRAKLLGGYCSVQNLAGQGSRVTIGMPMTTSKVNK